jgi:murein DD-endopeptidase MepM/ murein hydrolase activator NlpD
MDITITNNFFYLDVSIVIEYHATMSSFLKSVLPAYTLGRLIMFKKLTFIFIITLLSLNSFALEIKSEWVQGGMIIGQTDPSHQLRFLDRNVQVNDEGYFVVGLGRDAPKNAMLTEILSSGVKITHNFVVRQRSYREQRIEGVPKHTVDVPESALTRIRQEVKITKAARKENSTRQDFLQKFKWPAKGIISGVYGSRRFYNGQPRRPHFGVDIAAPQGSIVLAPVSGRVLLTHDNMYFSGGTLIIDHGHGVTSTFIHLYKILVSEGDSVEQGQPIAKIGSSGRATGPHLDWRMNWFTERLDPQLLMDGLPKR